MYLVTLMNLITRLLLTSIRILKLLSRKVFKFSFFLVLSLSVITGLLPLCVVVNAEDSVDVNIIDYESFGAYKFFENYGYKLYYDNLTFTDTTDYYLSESSSSNVNGTLRTDDKYIDLNYFNFQFGSNISQIECTPAQLNTPNNSKITCLAKQNGGGYSWSTNGNSNQGRATVTHKPNGNDGSISYSEYGTGTVTGHTTSTSTNYIQYKYPELSADNTVNRNEFVSEQMIAVSNNTTKILMFISSWYIGSNVSISYGPTTIGSATIRSLSSDHLGSTYYLNVYELKSNGDGRANFSIYFQGLNNTRKVTPIYFGNKASMPTQFRELANINSKEVDAINEVNDSVNNQTNNDNRIWEEQNDTSQVSELEDTTGDLVSNSSDKFNNLLYPIAWLGETAQNLTNVSSTGQVTLPAIFINDTWVLDLTVFERKLPTAWTFIQNICRLAVAWWLIMGLFNLFQGSTNNDS